MTIKPSDPFVAAQMISTRKREGTDRERLAAISHANKAAKHKGRNHWRNWERRQMALEAKRAGLARSEKRKAAFNRYCAEVRDFWRGLRSDHPEKP